MKGFRFLLLVMAICLASGVKAQFYDGPDDIFYYVTYEIDGQQLKEGEDPMCYIFNFDGLKACWWGDHFYFNVSGVKNKLISNPMYFEELVESTNYNLKYISDNTYQLRFRDGTTKSFHFSQDRNTMTYDMISSHTVDGSTVKTSTKCKRVDKSFFKVGRSRTPSSTLYE